MRVGVIGTGNMGRTLGILLAEQGHEVLFGARDADKAQEAAELAKRGARAGSNEEAAEFGELLVYGIRDVPLPEVLSNPGALEGKVVIDINNNESRTDGGAGPEGESLAEKLQAAAPRAQVVKAFNTYAQEVYELSPIPLNGHSAAMFLAGDSDDAKRTVAGLADTMGFVPVDCGPLRFARMLEAMADFTRHLMQSQGQPPTMVLSVVTMPPAKAPRMGGRQESDLK